MCAKIVYHNLGMSIPRALPQWQQKIASAVVPWCFYSLDLAAFGWRYSPYPRGGFSLSMCMRPVSFKFQSWPILTRPMSYFSLGSNEERKSILRNEGLNFAPANKIPPIGLPRRPWLQASQAIFSQSVSFLWLPGAYNGAWEWENERLARRLIYTFCVNL